MKNYKVSNPRTKRFEKNQCQYLEEKLKIKLDENV